MTQYKSVIVPIPNDEGTSYTAVAEAINRVITEQAADGWEVTLAQEMECGNKQGFFANIFGSKKKEKQTLLVFKKEEVKPAPQPPKEFDYDKFEQIVTKGMDYEKMANVMKKVVSETEVIISKKSFDGLKFSLPLPALPMNEPDNGPMQPQATFLIGEKSDAQETSDKGKNSSSKSGGPAKDEKGVALAKVLFDVLTKNAGKGISYPDILKETKGKLPKGATDADVNTMLNAFVEYKMVKKDGDLYSIE